MALRFAQYWEEAGLVGACPNACVHALLRRDRRGELVTSDDLFAFLRHVLAHHTEAALLSHVIAATLAEPASG